jgi:hypothetical protein
MLVLLECEKTLGGIFVTDIAIALTMLLRKIAKGTIFDGSSVHHQL